MRSHAFLESIKSEKSKFMNTRNEELKYMFRQPLPCLAWGIAPTLEGNFELCKGGGYTCPAAKFLAHLTPEH